MAATYESNGYRVTLGTEDGVALRHRGESNDGIGSRIASRLHSDGTLESEVRYDPFTETTPTALVLRLLDLRPGDDLELVFEVAHRASTSRARATRASLTMRPEGSRGTNACTIGTRLNHCS